MTEMNEKLKKKPPKKRHHCCSLFTQGKYPINQYYL